MMFYEILYYYHFIVMTTYMLAQTLIVFGMSGTDKNTLKEVSN
jgi:ABC-type enterochelin transport system permease subunit